MDSAVTIGYLLLHLLASVYGIICEKVYTDEVKRIEKEADKVLLCEILRQ